MNLHPLFHQHFVESLVRYARHIFCPAEEGADLYMERWQIEVKFRDLKTTLGMDCFAVKTPAMAHKTL